MALPGLQRPDQDAHSIEIVDRVKSSGSFNWSPDSGNRSIFLLAVGLGDVVYPEITSCNGEKSAKSERILPLLRRLLDCKSLRSLPDDADELHADRLTRFY